MLTKTPSAPSAPSAIVDPGTTQNNSPGVRQIPAYERGGARLRPTDMTLGGRGAPASRPSQTLGHYKLYIRLAAASARVHPARFPCASSRLARAKVAANAACAFSSARLTEAGVGWTSSCAPIDCGAIGPAFGFPADWRTACSNCAILLVHGPACAAATPRPRAAATSKVAEGRLIARRRICEHLHDVFDRALPRFPRSPHSVLLGEGPSAGRLTGGARHYTGRSEPTKD
jgi:hypothetical protein